jgi:hypothetical protein
MVQSTKAFLLTSMKAMCLDSRCVACVLQVSCARSTIASCVASSFTTHNKSAQPAVHEDCDKVMCAAGFGCDAAPRVSHTASGICCRVLQSKHSK